MRATTSSTVGLHGRGVGDVEPGGPRASAERRRGALRGLAVDVGAHHIGTCAGEGPAQRRTDPGSRTGDDGLLAAESHYASASFITWPNTSG